jgi:hypothetical protein
MKKVLEKFRLNTIVKLIICIVTISACVSCHMKSVEIEQGFKMMTGEHKPYVVSTYLVDYNNTVATSIIYADIEFTVLDSIPFFMEKQYRKAEKARNVLESIEKH